MKIRIILTAVVLFLSFIGAMTLVSMKTYENEKPVVVLGFAEEMVLYNRSGLAIHFDHVLPADVIHTDEGRGYTYHYVYVVSEITGTWGQREFAAVETEAIVIWHWELPYAVFLNDAEFLYQPIVFAADGVLYDGAKVRIK
jgi:hypothetical protein